MNMISLDTNLLFYACCSGSKYNEQSIAFVKEITNTKIDVVVGELVLVELYNLLRNSTVMAQPLSANEAVQVIDMYRNHPTWRLVEHACVMSEVWKYTAEKNFARRKIYDTRLALTLQSHGVKEVATANIKDFKDFGFTRVWNPLN